jgi:hypothetical protein
LISLQVIKEILNVPHCASIKPDFLMLSNFFHSRIKMLY